MQPSTRSRRARFGPFEVDLHNREVRRQGVRLRVQRQPFAVLETLLETPGDLVSREALRQRLWPDGTFIEFDKGLNTAVMKLREVLGEDSQSPHFIETVAGEGYRFVGAVEIAEPVLEPRLDDGAPHASHSTRDGDQRSSPTSNPPSATVRNALRKTGVIWLAATIALAACAVAALMLRPDAGPASSRLLRYTLHEPAGATFSTLGGFMALSPDGSALAYLASTADGIQRLFLQPLDSLTAQTIDDTEHAGPPFWSPDGGALAFFAVGRLKRFDLASRSLSTLDTALPIGVSGTWSEQGDVLYSPKRSASSAGDHHGLQLATASGGPATPLAMPDGVDPESYIWWPRFLPGGRSYLFLVLGAPDRNGIYVASLDGGPAERISPVISSAEYADGRLFYIDGGVLVARPFDPVARRFTGDALPVADGVLFNPSTGRGVFSVTAANGGIVAYRQPPRSRLEWFDRAGAPRGVVGPPAVYYDFAIAPDGERVAAAMLDSNTGTYDIWILAAGGTSRRLTVGSASEVSAIWSPDAARIAYVSDAGGRWQVFVQSVREGSAPELVAESAGSIAPFAWKGEVLHIGRNSAGVEVKEHPVSSVRIAADPAMGLISSVSPDHRFFAVQRDQSNSRLVTQALYVDAAPPRRGSWNVAARAGEPRWRGDSAELYYVADDRRLMAVSVGNDDSLDIGSPVALFVTPGVEPSGAIGSTYDVAPDGQRFLVKVAAEPATIVVLANWKSALD